MPSIIRTQRADEDLIAIWLSIASDNPSAADHVIDAIELHWRQLTLYPYSGPARDDIGPSMRHLLTGQYLTLYRVTDAGIEIIRVLHGRRKIDLQMVSS